MGATTHAPARQPRSALALPPERLHGLRLALRERLAAEEARLPRPEAEPTLFEHSLRVAHLALRLARATPGADVEESYLAALLHDAGKLDRLSDPCNRVAEEERSAEVARQLLGSSGFDGLLAARVATTIRALYREEVTPPLSTRLVEDADNLDKLGLPGAAVFFVKQGLRGIGVGPRLLAEVGVELTYARHAEAAMWTVAARRLAAPRARASGRFFRAFLRAVRADGFHRFVVRSLVHDGFALDAVVRERCACGGAVAVEVTTGSGVKCHLLRVRQSCAGCDFALVTELCRPRLRPAPRE